MRFTLVWAVATTFPKVMVTTDRIVKASCQSGCRTASARMKTLKAATKPIFFDPAASREETTEGDPW
jgi:hypothetical protein